MNTIITTAWMFPILFMLHDFEEIIMVGIWKERNQGKLAKMTKKQPFAHYKDVSSFASAVFFQFILYLVLTIIGITTSHYELWMGLFTGVIIHFAIHAKLCIDFKGYVPGITTSIVVAPACIYYFIHCTKLLHYSIPYCLLIMVVGTVVALGMFKFLTKSLYKWHDISEHYRTGKKQTKVVELPIR